ncbi:MAG: substrate-binding domain-containing protein [Pseudolabrys sp.]
MLAVIGSTAAETIQLYGPAGSLKGALTDVAKAYEAASGNVVQAKFGASGLLKDEIVGGAKTDVFASANMEHPQALHDGKKSGAVLLFARNKLLCAGKAGPSRYRRNAARSDARPDDQTRQFDTQSRSVRRLCLRGLRQG